MGMEKYLDIIDHEHHVSTRHQRMSELDRAAQFAPFAALKGYDDVIRDTDTQVEADRLPDFSPEELPEPYWE